MDKGTRALKQIETQKNEWLEVLLKGFSRGERLQLPGMVKRLIKSNVHFAGGEV